MSKPVHEAFMRLAIRQAELALARGDGPIGCVVVRDSEVIAQAGNMVYFFGLFRRIKMLKHLESRYI